MYGTKQTGKIWGSLLEKCLHSWKSQTSSFDARLYFFRQNEAFIIVAIVVDDISFASNSHSLMTWFKEKLSAQFDIRLFGSLSYFIGWEVSRKPKCIRATQTRYAKSLLAANDLDQANSVWTPLPLNADVMPAYENEDLLSPAQHSQYRSSIGGLNYLAVCTRPDIYYFRYRCWQGICMRPHRDKWPYSSGSFDILLGHLTSV